ncbi:bacillithiol biosynthesis deacetylase BshB1 [candidate division KSB3 bacterium]|uniref:Bacillithiol biosynthesis deacetylase BshB1 n=1 Tax=candidate division KSB3 bacterium TaxID=2044937 RepID=A0A9D5JT47_9BACT|nr:bacillithiol biosynthesis deacetylase BshB1 [candidate division KSB3 bacterium]MBD3323526.1 bacillithiol biosynthesis deacetylase BshB1 [candidate division KSB3 bacterium]
MNATILPWRRWRWNMLDVLAVGAHPDDCEIVMGGTICVLKHLSYRVGICDLCAGEAGTYGSAEIRRKELQEASERLRLDARTTLDMPDGNIRNTEENRLKLIDVIREHQPEIMFSFYNELTRHPDHYFAGQLVKECVFLAGLEKIRTNHPPHRPSALITFKGMIMQDKPDFVVDISDYWEQKVAAIKAYESQVIVHDQAITQAEQQMPSKTFIRTQAFWEVLEARARIVGAMIGVKYGEAFYSDAPPKIADIPTAFKR